MGESCRRSKVSFLNKYYKCAHEPNRISSFTSKYICITSEIYFTILLLLFIFKKYSVYDFFIFLPDTMTADSKEGFGFSPFWSRHVEFLNFARKRHKSIKSFSIAEVSDAWNSHEFGRRNALKFSQWKSIFNFLCQFLVAMRLAIYGGNKEIRYQIS